MKHVCLFFISLVALSVGKSAFATQGESSTLYPRYFHRDDSAFPVSDTRSHDKNYLHHSGGWAQNFYFLPKPETLYTGCGLFWESYEVDMDGDSVADFVGTEVEPIHWQYPAPPVGEIGHEQITITAEGACGPRTATFDVLTLAEPNVTFRSPEGDSMTGYLSDDGILDRPVVVIEGVDTTNETWPSFYMSRLLPLREQLPPDYDLLVYNYADGGASVRENAMGVLGALRKLEQLDLPFETRVVGISMGGVVARYALAYAEEHEIDHGCNLFVSADAPQQGAWLNVELQDYVKQMKDLAGNSVPALNRFSELLQRPATLELVRENVYDPDYPALRPEDTQNRGVGDEISGGQVYRDFFHELNGLNGNGYPKRTLNVGLSNGAGDIESRYLQAAARDNWIDQTSFLRFRIEGFEAAHLTMKEQDVYAGSYQPALKAAVFPGAEHLSFFIFHFKIGWELELTGVPSSYIWANSALDLWGIERSLHGEVGDILDWDETKFDEIYINPSTTGAWPSEHNAYHDDFSSVLVETIIDKLHEEPCSITSVQIETGPPLVAGEVRTISADLSGRCARDVEFLVSYDEGHTWELIESVPAPDMDTVPNATVEIEWEAPAGPRDHCVIKAVGVPFAEAVSEPFTISDGIGPNYGGTLVLHWEPSIVYTAGEEYCGAAAIQSCDEVNAKVEYEGGVSGDWLLHAFAAFPTTSRLAAVSFALDYHHFLEVDDYGTCADFEVTDSNWPDSGSGASLSWEEPVESTFVPLYWFQVHSDINEFVYFTTKRHPGNGGYFLDDSTPPVRSPIVDHGVVSYAAGGVHVPCPETWVADVNRDLYGDVHGDGTVDRPPSPTGATLICEQNPIRSRATFSRQGGDGDRWKLQIFDAAGALVRSEEVRGHRWNWDMKSNDGERVPTGVYFASTDDPRVEPVKLAVVR